MEDPNGSRRRKPGTGAASSFLFAGGGSGGHISPALAIAERIRELEPSSRSLFVCSTRDIDAAMLTESQVRFEPITAAPWGIRPASLIRFVVNHRRSSWAARSLIRSESVDRVVALGGFVSAPVIAAARKCQVPVTLVNLDAPPGRANRWMARHCEQVFSAIDVTNLPGFAPRVVGMPIRRCALAPGEAQRCRGRLGLDQDTLTLLVTGASQGARSINALFLNLAASQPQMFTRWQVYHLCGSADGDALRAAYAEADIPAVVEPFVHRMGLAWGASDLAVSRAGASSVAEAWANTVPTVFMPYPYHRDHHQRHNAEPMVALGGAVIESDRIDPAANAAGVGATIRALLSDDERRAAMRANLRAHPAPDAADTIARILLGLPEDSARSPAIHG